MTDMKEFESRIKSAKAKRERLMGIRSEKVALLKSAREKMDKLKEKAESKGFNLEDLPALIDEKKKALETKIKGFEEALTTAETLLSKYED
jgi:UDP-N-acetylmuramyl pentapeptide synthase